MDNQICLAKAEETIVSDENGIRYIRRYPFWIRLFLFPWFLLCVPFIHLYLEHVRLVDWASPPVFETIFATLGFLVVPLSFSGMVLWFALFGDAVDLALNARTCEVILLRRSPFRNRLTCYPLSNLQIYKIALEANTAYDSAIVTMRMPDGVKVKIRSFYRDEEALSLVQHVEKLITNASKVSFCQPQH